MASVDELLTGLGVGAVAVGDDAWRIELESAGHPLVIGLSLRGPLLRAEALVLPADAIEPRQLLFWNGQAPLVCFALDGRGDVTVCGEVPVAALDPEMADRFLGLLHASATRARQFVLGVA